jgi:hypothetical protein
MSLKAIPLKQLSLMTVILMLAACQNSETQEVDNVNVTDNKPRAVSEHKKFVRPAVVSVDEQIKGALSDLASRTGVKEKDIKVMDARSVQWRSGAIGCPKPGMNYTQAIVPGMLLLLEANGTVYHYHGKAGQSLFYCPAERAQAPLYEQGQDVM